MHTTTLLSAALLSSFASAHFVLHFPKSLGFSDDDESKSPCGGFDVKFSDDDTSASVNGFQVALMTTHPQAQFLVRGTLSTEAPFNWTNLMPVVDETGVGDFCMSDVKAPTSWADKKGVVQVIQDGPDGILYQCAPVKFVSSSGSTDSACKNGTGVKSTITANSNFTGSSSDASSSSAAPAASATSSGLAAQATAGILAAGFGLAAVGMGLV